MRDLPLLGVLDDKLATIAQVHQLPEHVVPAAPQTEHIALVLARLKPAARQGGR